MAFKDFIDTFRRGEEEPSTTAAPPPAYHTDDATVLSDDKGSGKDLDSEKGNGPEVINADLGESTAKGSSNEGLKRRLSGRHMQMIAFGGSIGTGLFVGSGGALATGGPASLMLGFILIGFLLLSVVMALGELAATFPVSGSFAKYSTMFVDPSWGFAMGWNYLLQWIVVLPLELTAASIVITYWDPNETVPKGIWVALFLIFLTISNFWGVRGYGEIEFVTSMIKITACIGFIILGIVINVGGAPNNKYYGAHTWYEPGAFNHGFKGFVSVFVTAAFSYAGTELVGLAAAECANPRKEVPRACKQIFWRILIFYVISLLLISFLVPYDDARLTGGSSSYDARASPFVISIVSSGISVLPSIFNAVILVSVLSVGNTAVYASSRTLTGLAQAGLAPGLFKYVDRAGRPIPAVILALLFGLLGFLIYATSKDLVFSWMLAISGLSSLFTWGSICWAHFRFRHAWRRQGHSLDELSWTSPLGIWGSYFGAGFTVLVLIAQFYIAAFPIGEGGSAAGPDPIAEPAVPKMSGADRVNAFFLAYLAAPIVLVCFVGHKIYSRSSWVSLDEMDLTTGRKGGVPIEVLRREREEAAAQPKWKRILKAIF